MARAKRSQYACEYGSVAICKLLVEFGVDVDRPSPDIYSSRWLCLPVQTCTERYSDLKQEEMVPRLECAKILLQAGADPTLISSNSYGLTHSPLFHCMAPGGYRSSIVRPII